MVSFALLPAQTESFKWIVTSNTVFSKTTVEHVKTLEEEEEEEKKKKKKKADYQPTGRYAIHQNMCYLQYTLH